MKFRALLSLVTAVTVTLLSACGGGGTGNSSSDANVRLANVTEQASLDLFADGDPAVTGVAPSGASGYAVIDDGGVTLQARAGGVSQTNGSFSLGKGNFYTLVAYGAGSTTRAILLDENESEPGSGSTKLRVLNASNEAGPVDIYLTAANQNTDLASVQPIHAGVAAEQTSSFGELTAGNYQVRVTTADDRNRVLLNLPSVAFGGRQVVTLVLSRTSGGVLVHGLLLVQEGAATAQRNTSVRVRLAASASGGAAVAATVGGTALATAQASPSVSDYTLVPSGATTATASIGGSPVTLAAPPATTGGEDLTLLVRGSGGTAGGHWIVDDNRLPLTTSGNTVSTGVRLRLVHGLNGLTSPNDTLAMTVNGSSVANNLAPGAASGAITRSATSFQVLVSTPATATPLYNNTDLDLATGGSYTVFMLGDYPGSVTPLIRDGR